jgi:LacI family transcriptional regulator
MRSLLADPPQAVLPLSSRLVMGDLRAAWEAGIRIPRDLALTGYGDPADSKSGGPALPPSLPPWQRWAPTPRKTHWCT